MIKEFTCIICPNGCEIEVELQQNVIGTITGGMCSKGEVYVRQELTNPQGNIATSILVRNGELPLASVRLTSSIPKDKLLEAIKLIKTIHVDAPVMAGTIVLHRILGFESDVIVTKTVLAQPSFF